MHIRLVSINFIELNGYGLVALIPCETNSEMLRRAFIKIKL